MLPIRRIVTGPGVDYERNFSSLRAFLESKGHADVEIAPSKVPFRGPG